MGSAGFGGVTYPVLIESTKVLPKYPELARKAKVTGNVVGRGFSKNVMQCYRFIFDNYEAGDDIFESWQMNVPNTNGFNPTLFAFDSMKHPALQADTNYWIVAESNAQQVRKIRQVLDGLSLEVASPAEARDLLSLKGGDQVGF